MSATLDHENVTLSQIAFRIGKTQGAVRDWTTTRGRRRFFPPFPPPVGQFRMRTPKGMQWHQVWDWAIVELWLEHTKDQHHDHPSTYGKARKRSHLAPSESAR